MTARSALAALVLAAGLIACTPDQNDAHDSSADLAGLDASLDSVVQKVRELEDALDASIGFAAVHVESGARASHNGTERYPMRSVYKLPIAVTVFRLIDAGRLRLDSLVTVTPADFAPLHSPLRDKAGGRGLTVTVDSLLVLMIADSDAGRDGGPAGRGSRRQRPVAREPPASARDDAADSHRTEQDPRAAPSGDYCGAQDGNRRADDERRGADIAPCRRGKRRGRCVRARVSRKPRGQGARDRRDRPGGVRRLYTPRNNARGRRIIGCTSLAGAAVGATSVAGAYVVRRIWLQRVARQVPVPNRSMPCTQGWPAFAR